MYHLLHCKHVAEVLYFIHPFSVLLILPHLEPGVSLRRVLCQLIAGHNHTYIHTLIHPFTHYRWFRDATQLTMRRRPE